MQKVFCLIGCLAIAGCTTDAFNWIDGHTYRLKEGATTCLEDGSLVWFERAGPDGKFDKKYASSVANCGG